MAIKVIVTSEPTKREIQIECPTCHTMLLRRIQIGIKEGDDKCALCETTFHWKEE